MTGSRSHRRIAELEALVDRAGGVASARSLRELGFSPYEIERATGVGALRRVRRRWLAAASADPALLRAAEAGVVLTCVTQARRLGLWVLAEVEPHVAAPSHAGAVRVGRARVHWAKPLLARPPEALVDPIENVLGLVASCQPFETALAIWESALKQGAANLPELRRLRLGPAARELCRLATPWSDSGLESLVLPRLRWMGLPIVPQAWIAGHRVDFLIGARLVLQIDGAHHVGAQREQDNAHDARLMLMGFHVVRVGYFQVVECWPQVQDTLMKAIGQGLHKAA